MDTKVFELVMSNLSKAYVILVERGNIEQSHRVAIHMDRLIMMQMDKVS
jgi:hypothetical protein